jgi:hypothetical protein
MRSIHALYANNVQIIITMFYTDSHKTVLFTDILSTFIVSFYSRKVLWLTKVGLETSVKILFYKLLVLFPNTVRIITSRKL